MKAEWDAKGSCRGSKAPKSQERTSTQALAVLCRRARVCVAVFWVDEVKSS